ncbi:MAG TPA: NrfD/PsrC family molybdoenzyme membrane anchor subunit [Gemmatimonadales bacterium]|nr:NrfD/PsrC family molybdoenzyme membrane anchor subunit [Gemmatimonadales bacterium]
MTESARQDAYRRGANAPAGTLLAAGAILAIVGFGIFITLAMGHAADRAWRMFLINFLFFTGLAQGALIFAATQKMTKAKWSGSMIRFAEAGVAFLPVALVLFLILFLGRNYLFPWIGHPTPVRGRWLTTSWVFWRDLVSFIVVFGIAFAFVRNDMKPDLLALRDQATGWRRNLYDRVLGGYTGTPEELEKVERRVGMLAPLMVVAYGYLFSLIGFDLIMSLAPYWYSNLFGAFFFLGAFLTGLTTSGIMMVYWRGRLGLHDLIGRQQFHDLGKLVFGFTIFWGYLLYSQIIVIWYGKLPDETGFFFMRIWGEWRPMAWLVLAMVFLIPFWGLIWVKSKVTPFTFTLFVTVSLAGIWFERFLLVEPSLGAKPAFGLPEVGITAGFLGLYLLAYGLFARTFPMVSPRLAEKSLHVGHH